MSYNVTVHSLVINQEVYVSGCHHSHKASINLLSTDQDMILLTCPNRRGRHKVESTRQWQQICEHEHET